MQLSSSPRLARRWHHYTDLGQLLIATASVLANTSPALGVTEVDTRAATHVEQSQSVSPQSPERKIAICRPNNHLRTDLSTSKAQTRPSRPVATAPAAATTTAPTAPSLREGEQSSHIQRALESPSLPPFELSECFSDYNAFDFARCAPSSGSSEATPQLFPGFSDRYMTDDLSKVNVIRSSIPQYAAPGVAGQQSVSERRSAATLLAAQMQEILADAQHHSYLDQLPPLAAATLIAAHGGSDELSDLLPAWTISGRKEVLVFTAAPGSVQGLAEWFYEQLTLGGEGHDAAAKLLIVRCRKRVADCDHSMEAAFASRKAWKSWALVRIYRPSNIPVLKHYLLDLTAGTAKVFERSVFMRQLRLLLHPDVITEVTKTTYTHIRGARRRSTSTPASAVTQVDTSSGGHSEHSLTVFPPGEPPTRLRTKLGSSGEQTFPPAAPSTKPLITPPSALLTEQVLSRKRRSSSGVPRVSIAQLRCALGRAFSGRTKYRDTERKCGDRSGWHHAFSQTLRLSTDANAHHACTGCGEASNRA